jgi:hypothetical protein
MLVADEDAIRFLESEVLPLLASEGARALLRDAIEAERHPHRVPELQHTKQLQRDERLRRAIIPTADR